MRRAFVLLLLASVLAGFTHGISTFNGGKSQGQSGFLQPSADDPFINELKTAQNFTYGDNSANANPSDLDVNGYPLNGSNGFSHSGYTTVFFGPSQAERPGNHVVLAGGAGKILASENVGGGAISNVSCQYTSNGGALTNGTYSGGCDTSACTGVCTMQWVFSVSGETIPSGFVEWKLSILATKSGNPLQNIAFIHADDQTIFHWTMAGWPGPNAVSHNPHIGNTGEIFGALYKQRVAQGGFGVWRFMDWMGTAVIAVAPIHWADRKPTSYAYYKGPEMRASIYVGTPTYALHGSSNDYSATLGTGPPTDKQIITALWGTTATTNTITFNLNGTGALPLFTDYGAAVPNSGYYPTSGFIGSLVYDADLNGWLSFSGSDWGVSSALNNNIPPETTLQFAIEARVHPWYDEPTYASVPITDYMPSLAAYIKANAPSWMIPRFTAGNEPFNNQPYASVKSQLYWSINSPIDWFGMAATLLCQSLFNVWGAKDGSKYECMVEPQTVAAANSSQFPLLTSNLFVLHGPAQAGYTQTPAYDWLTAIAINNYWVPPENVGSNATQIAAGIVQDGWCYVNQGSGCLSPAAIITALVNTALNNGNYGLPTYNTFFVAYAAWLVGGGSPCAGHSSGCNITHMYAYEGGYGPNFFSADLSNTVSSATNAASAVLTTSAANGCYVGQTVALTGVTGGTWAASYTGLTVSAVGTNTCTVNIDSTSLGTLTAGTLTYTGSKSYINAMLTASFASPTVGTLTLTNYANFIAAGGKWPSMFYLSAVAYSTGNEWSVWTPSIYGATDSVNDPGTPQWQAIQQFNGTGSCPTC